ncbi:MAG: hypothetical protein PWP65_1639 [Clostridia bacterium]|nr:hypothetical protein [Clostridia bacterium]
MEKKESLSKRQIILEAAAKVFAAKGFYRATIEEIALAAGVGKGTVYEYFRSKKDLFERLLTEGSLAHLAPLQEVLTRAATTREKLELIFRTFLHFAYNHRDLARLLLTERPPLGAEFCSWVYQQRLEKIKLFTALVEAGIKGGELNPVNPSLAATLIFGVLVSLGHRLALDQIDLGPDETARQAIELLWRGLGSK